MYFKRVLVIKIATKTRTSEDVGMLHLMMKTQLFSCYFLRFCSSWSIAFIWIDCGHLATVGLELSEN